MAEVTVVASGAGHSALEEVNVLEDEASAAVGVRLLATLGDEPLGRRRRELGIGLVTGERRVDVRRHRLADRVGVRSPRLRRLDRAEDRSSPS